MKRLIFACLAALSIATVCVTNTLGVDNRLYELRIYSAPAGKLDDLHARFRNHTMKIFEKHGIHNVGYFVPLADNPDNKLYYIVSYPNKAARDESWKAFRADPDWQKAQKESEANGKIVAKVESIFLAPTDYSPTVEIKQQSPERVFELRTYKTHPGKLSNLNARFRDHTVGLFKKHGMTNVGYWVPTEEKDGSADTLIYLLAHKSRDAAKESFSNFGKDADWQAARKASETDGPLTTKVESLFLKPTDYSPMK